MNVAVPKRFSDRALARLADLVVRHPRWFFWPQLALFFAATGYTVAFLEFEPDRNALVGADKRYHKIFLEYKREFAAQDDLVAVVESDCPEKNRQFVERLGARLEGERVRVRPDPDAPGPGETNLFKNIFFKADLKMLGAKALLFVPEPELRELQMRLAASREFLQPFTRATNLVSLVDLINFQFRSAQREADPQTTALLEVLPTVTRLLQQAADCLPRHGVPPSPGVQALFDPSRPADQSIYLTLSGGQIYLATAQPGSMALREQAVRRLRELVAEIRTQVPGVNAGLTGELVLELDELAQSQRDTLVASVVALGLTALIFIYGYHEIARPLQAVACLVVGIGYTMGFATLVIGHLNILTITFVPILIGLAIDFGVHLVTRFEEELQQGQPMETAITRAIVFTGKGIFTGAFTTAGAFFAMSFTDFRGIQEMGIICGGGLLVCLIPMLTLLPVLLLRGRPNRPAPPAAAAPGPLTRIEQLWLVRPKTVLFATAALVALSVTQTPKVFFDYNLLHLQSPSLPAVRFQEKLLQTRTTAESGPGAERVGHSVLFAAVVANSAAEAAALAERIRPLDAVARVETIAPLLVEDPAPKLKLIGAIKATVATLQFGEPDPRPVSRPDLGRGLFALGGFARLAQEETRSNNPTLAGQLDQLHAAASRLRLELWRGSEADQHAIAIKLGSFQRALFEDLRTTFETLQNQDDRAGLQVGDVPPVLRARFVSGSGKHLVQVYPKEDVWERAPQEEFIRQLRTVAPDVTGTPVQFLEYVSLLKASYEKAAGYALMAITFLVFIHFRRVGRVGLALLPVGLGGIWLAGAMGGFAIPLNPANIMLLPLVLGIGITNGIHILNRYAEEQDPGILANSTGKAVVVSGLTTVAGFGSLMLAEHRGIASLGLVMAIGVATCMVGGLTSLPALMKLLRREKKKTQ